MEILSMFLDYYQLRQQPFGTVSESTQIYPSQTYCEALESLSESLLADRGSLTLTAEPGMGKTTLLSQVLDGLRKSGRSAFLFQKECSSREILQSMLGEMRVDSSGMDASAMQSKLNGLWFAEMLSGRRFVLLFDDAEQLGDSGLETVQSLARYETTSTKLVQVVLCGQPRLEQTLQRGSLTSLRKRMAHTMHLQTLTPMETAGYVRHRLKVAGYRGESLFTAEALAHVAENSGGIPCNINKICSRALLEAYARGLRAVSADIIEKAGRNLQSTNAAEEAASAPPAGTTATTAKETARERTASLFPEKPPGPVALPRSGLWAGAIVGLLLSAGLALPHGMLLNMTQLISGIKASAASLPPPPVFEQPESSPQSERTRRSVLTGDPPQFSFAPKQASAVDPSIPAVASPLPTPSRNRGSQISLTRELGLKINRIVIDAGHGGWDTGAKGPHGLMEKDVCLDVALRLGQLIEQNIPGAQVVYTRKDDTFIPLEERTAIGNRADADLFISIHANSSSSRDVRGVETYYLSLATSSESKELAIRENSLTQSSLHDLPDLIKKITNNEKIAQSRELATDIQNTLARRLQLVSSHEKNRGVKQAPFIVLTGANMPAVLSEISFVTNDTDEILLLENGQRQRIAEGLYRGIMAYFDGLAGVQLNKQKLLTENRTGATATFQHPTTNDGRSPL
jgi:N-acetylmuramoyl-L-alanine amidase